MPIVEKEFSLDIVPGYLPPTINVSEYDIGRSYTITLLNDGESFEIPSGAAAIIEGTLEDYVYHSTRIVKAVFRENATISNNKVKFTLTESMTPYKGQVWCKVKLTLGEDTISSCGFIMAVDRAGTEAEVVISARGFDEQIKDAVSEYIDEEGLESNSVSYTSAQNLTAEQKYRARKNIEAYGNSWDTTPIRLRAEEQYLGDDGGYVNFIRGPYPRMLSENFENFNMPMPEIATRIRQGSLVLLLVNKDTRLLYDICSSGTGDIDSVVFYPTSVSGAMGPTAEWYAGLEGQLLFYEDDPTLSIRFECRDPRVYKNVAIVHYKEYTFTSDNVSFTETYAVAEFSHEDFGTSTVTVKEKDSQIVTPSGNVPTTETTIYTHTVTNAGHYLITANACGQYTSTTVDRALTLTIKVNGTIKAQTISTSASSWYAEGALSINEELSKNDVVTVTVVSSKDSLAVKGVWHAGLCQLI